MGLKDFFVGGVREVLIHRPDEFKNHIIFKHPDPTIPSYSQLTVDADEAAVFFRDGSPVGVLRSAGVGARHQLSSENIPFLGQILDKVTNAQIFLTDLYFVTTRPFYGEKFGDELGLIEDPMLGEAVTPRIFGTLAFQVVDPQALIMQYTGLGGQRSNEQVLKWVKDSFINGVRDVVGKVCIEEQKSLLQLMAMQKELAERFVAECPKMEQIGCRILEIGGFRLSLNDEDETRLKDAQSEIGAAKRAARVANIGISEAQAMAAQKQFELDQSFANDARYVQQLAGSYQGYASGKAMIGAGEGMSKGGGEGGSAMMGGAGLGVGFGMANAMSQQIQVPQGAAPATPVSGATVQCPGCSANVPGGKFCAQCGGGLAPKPAFCSACGTPSQGTARFCASCGTAFPQTA